MKSLPALMIDQKRIEASLQLLKMKINRRGYVKKEDMEEFDKLIKEGEPIFEELEKHEGQPRSIFTQLNDIANAVQGFKALKQQTQDFYKTTKLCKDGIYRTPEEMQKQGIKG